MVPRAAKKATSAKPVIPYLGRGDGKPNPARSAKTANPLTTKLNMKTWDVDPVAIIRHILGQEVKVDEHSGMVSHPRQQGS
jgi:hypothetical protein